MGLIVVPAAAGLILCIFPGLIVGIAGVLRHQRPLVATGQWLGLTLALFAVVFGAPFLVLQGQPVFLWGFVLGSFCYGGGVLVATGLGFWAASRRTKRPLHALVSGAAFVAAGLLSIAWIVFGERLATAVGIRWTY